MLKCDFSFLQKEKLSTHITSVHEISKLCDKDQKSKKYPCNDCNKKFSSIQNLKSHTKNKHGIHLLASN